MSLLPTKLHHQSVTRHWRQTSAADSTCSLQTLHQHINFYNLLSCKWQILTEARNGGNSCTTSIDTNLVLWALTNKMLSRSSTQQSVINYQWIMYSQKSFTAVCSVSTVYTHMHAHTHTHTHTHTPPFNGPLSRTTRVSQYQKGKTNLDFTEAIEGEWQ